MKQKNNKQLAFYREYISNYTSSFNNEQIDKIYQIQKKIEEKIDKKKFIFVCETVGLLQLQIIFCVILIKE